MLKQGNELNSHQYFGPGQPKYDDVEKVISDAWNFKSKHLNGYEED